jgi:hypothetical protein
MQLIDTPITRHELELMAKKGFGNLVKAVVDIRKKIMVVDASLHADEEAMLLSEGSSQTDLWGINLYPELIGDEFIEFDSMINIRPGQGNSSRGVDDPKVKKRIIEVVSLLVQ